jgi:glutathione peroxidase
MRRRWLYGSGAMLTFILAAGIWACQAFGQSAIVKDPTTKPAAGSIAQPAGPLDFAVKDIDGKDVNLSDYRGKVVMIVNVASKCGFTPQYAGLEKLYETYKDQGFVILGFPANNFMSQEPGSNQDIKTFCTSKYNVTFPMMSKISVKGADKAPLYKFLTEEPTAGDFKGDIGWNFTKFVIDRNGNVIARFASKYTPADPQLVGIVQKALAAK